MHPIFPVGGFHPPVGRILVVDRGPEAKGPWAFHGGTPLRPDHLQTLNFKGNEVAPIGRVDVRSQTLVAVKGTAPGTRAVLGGSSFTVRPPANSTYYGNTQQRNGFASTGTQRTNQPTYNQRPPAAAYNSGTPAVNYQRPQGYNQPQAYNQQRNTYVAQPASTPHYSSPPPPQQHYSAPPPSHSAPAGNHR